MISRQMAELAERMADEGYDAHSVAAEMRGVADAEEFGWLGTKYVTVLTGLVPEDWEALTLDNVHALLSDKKTVSMKALREALGEDE
jgi:hypothetical protein